MIRIRMLKLCGGSICQLLGVIFKTSLWNYKFLLEREKANVVSIEKKDDKYTIKSCRPVSLLFVGKYLNACFMKLGLNFFYEWCTFFKSFWIQTRRFWCQSTSLVLLVMGLLKFVDYSLIPPKLLAKYGMMDWFLNCVKMVFWWND